MPAITSSKNSRASKRPKAASAPGGYFAPAGAFLFLALLGTAFAWLTFVNGWTLYYGDAEAHLNIARRIIDSRTPGWEQIGTVWLPLPHLLMLPFVSNRELWQTGLAGAIPGVFCFALGGAFLFAAAQLAFGSTAAGAAAALVYALNPNLLYLQSAPMTEPVFLCALCGLLWFTVRFRHSHGLAAAAGAGLCSAAASLTRYEGWFLIPFACLYILLAGGKNRWKATFVFGLIASAAPVWWMVHNQWFYSDPLEFYRGQWSAKAIYQRALDGGMERYPGDHDWPKAAQYYMAAVRLCLNEITLGIAAAGVLAALAKRAWWPVLLCALVPGFYVLSLYSSGTPIFVPHLWPNSYYNTRYGIGVLPLAALGAGALAAWMPLRFRPAAALFLGGAAAVPWLASPRPENWVTWKESQVNSAVRRQWTSAASRVIGPQYRAGSGILFPFGDMTAVLREAGIPLAEGVHEGNGPQSVATLQRPDLFLREEWVLASSGDSVSSAMMKAAKRGPSYQRVATIQEKTGPTIEIYRRTHDYSLYEGARRPERLSADMAEERAERPAPRTRRRNMRPPHRRRR